MEIQCFITFKTFLLTLSAQYPEMIQFALRQFYVMITMDCGSNLCPQHEIGKQNYVLYATQTLKNYLFSSF